MQHRNPFEPPKSPVGSDPAPVERGVGHWINRISALLVALFLVSIVFPNVHRTMIKASYALVFGVPVLMIFAGGRSRRLLTIAGWFVLLLGVLIFAI